MYRLHPLTNLLDAFNIPLERLTNGRLTFKCHTRVKRDLAIFRNVGTQKEAGIYFIA